VERGGAAAAPFMDGERVARGRERHSLIIQHETDLTPRCAYRPGKSN
jgi:hypothetical protein